MINVMMPSHHQMDLQSTPAAALHRVRRSAPPTRGISSVHRILVCAEPFGPASVHLVHVATIDFKEKAGEVSFIISKCW